MNAEEYRKRLELDILKIIEEKLRDGKWMQKELKQLHE